MKQKLIFIYCFNVYLNQNSNPSLWNIFPIINPLGYEHTPYISILFTSNSQAMDILVSHIHLCQGFPDIEFDNILHVLINCILFTSNSQAMDILVSHIHLCQGFPDIEFDNILHVLIN